MTFSNFESEIILLLGITIAAFTIGASAGWRHPGIDARSTERLIWSIADIIWITISIFAVYRVIATLDDAIYRGRIENAKLISLENKDSINRALWDAYRKFCVSKNSPHDENNAICANLEKIQSDLASENFNHASAEGLEATAIPVLCPHEKCDAVLNEVKTRVIRFRKYFIDNRSLLEHSSIPTPGSIEFFGVYLSLYFVALVARIGRSSAEIRRNREPGATSPIVA
jgi:hypothetical protein